MTKIKKTNKKYSYIIYTENNKNTNNTLLESKKLFVSSDIKKDCWEGGVKSSVVKLDTTKLVTLTCTFVMEERKDALTPRRARVIG